MVQHKIAGGNTMATRKGTATTRKATASKAGTKQHTHIATVAVGKHTTPAQRAKSLACTGKANVGKATSLRGVKRNLRLEGHGTLYVVKAKSGKFAGTFAAALCSNGKQICTVQHNGTPVKTVASLNYGQWVAATVASVAASKASK